MIKSNFNLIMVCMLVFVNPAFAQFQFGPLVGANLSSLNIPDDPIKLDDRDSRVVNTKSGLVAGATIIYNFSSMFSVQLEPAYTQKGASIYTTQTDVGLILEIDQTIEMDYIDVPVLFKVSFDGDFIKPFLLGGANIGIPLENTKVRIDKVIANGEDVTYIIPSEVIEQELKNESIDYGLNFGAGILFPIGAINMFFQGQYNIGLTDLNTEAIQEGVQQDVIKNRGFQIKTGILVSL